MSTKLRDEWGSIWTRTASKTHIMPECRYVTDRHRQIAVEDYPETYVDLCEWCEGRFNNWRGGVDTASKCSRCGCHVLGGEYCGDCQDHIRRVEAQR